MVCFPGSFIVRSGRFLMAPLGFHRFHGLFVVLSWRLHGAFVRHPWRCVNFHVAFMAQSWFFHGFFPMAPAWGAFMALSDHPWYFHGFSWVFTDFHATRVPLGSRGTSMAFHGFPWCFYGAFIARSGCSHSFLGAFMDVRRFSWACIQRSL